MRFTGVTPPTADERLNAVAALQRGIVTWRQLLAVGLSEDQIRTRLTRSQLNRVHRGVYTTATLPLVSPAAETAALLACGGGAVISHLSALNLWNLTPTSQRPAATIHVVRLPGSSRGCKLTGITVHQTGKLPRNHVRRHQQLLVTSPERTLLDCAQHLTARQLESAVNEALGRRITSLSKLRAVLTEHRHAPGRGRLEATLAARTTSTVTKLEAEERFLTLIRAAGLPDPHTQVNIYDQSLDAYWPQARFAVEIDSRAWHSSPVKFVSDRRKDQILRDHGIVVARTTWEQITQRPLELISHVTRQIALRTDGRAA